MDREQAQTERNHLKFQVSASNDSSVFTFGANAICPRHFAWTSGEATARTANDTEQFFHRRGKLHCVCANTEHSCVAVVTRNKYNFQSENCQQEN